MSRMVDYLRVARRLPRTREELTRFRVGDRDVLQKSIKVLSGKRAQKGGHVLLVDEGTQKVQRN